MEVGGCDVESETRHIIFERVTFRDNRLNATTALLVANTSCTSVQMADVDFVDNTCSGTCFAHLSLDNRLRDVRLEGNKRSGDASPFHTLISLPTGSKTAASGVTVIRNDVTAMRVRSARSLHLTDSHFSENANVSVITLHDVAEVQISDCSFSRNAAPEADGAAVTSFRTNLVILRCRFDGNAADSGGAIAARESAVRLENCLFQNGKADRNGAAVDVTAGSVVILSTTFENNAALQSGGAIHAGGTRIAITNCTMQHNAASVRGGAAALTDNSSLHAQSTKFYNNSAQLAGGALGIERSRGHIIQCSFQKNRAFDGGAIDGRSESFARIQRAVFVQNSATDNGGGGLHIAGGCDIHLSDAFFSENVAGRYGGGIVLSGSKLTAWNVTIKGGDCPQGGGGIRVMEASQLNLSHSTLRDNRAGFGGCLMSKHSSVRISDVTFRNCTAAAHGGALNIEEKSAVELNATRIVGNEAAEFGGGIRCRNASILASDLRLERNTASQFGGGLFASQGSDVTLHASKVVGNRCEDGKGGGIAVRSETHADFERVRFRNNSVRLQGGALLIELSIVTVRRCAFSENAAAEGGSVALKSSEVTVSQTSFRRDTADRGGSINAFWSSNLTFSDVTVTSANASLGGGLYLSRSCVEARALRIVGNLAAENGGGLYAGHSSAVLCSACVFEANDAGSRGGAVLLNATEAQMLLAYQFEHSRFVRNHAGLGGKSVTTRKRTMCVPLTGAVFFVSRHSEEDCARPAANCTFVALIATPLVQNSASAGGALFVSDPKTVRYRCTAPVQRKDLEFRSVDNFGQMTLLNGTSACPQWNGNKADAFGHLAASFARSVRSFVKREATGVFKKWQGRVLHVPHHKSGDALPSIRLQVVDGFGQGPATGTGNASVEAVMWSSEQFFTGNISVFLDNGEAEISGVTGFQRPGVYRVNIDFSEDVLPRLTIVVSIRDCAFGEWRPANGTFCSPCSESQFNFDADQECHACPENGDCSAGTAIQPKAGYWHGDPCAQQIQQCPVDEACAFTDRAANLSALTEGLHSCEHNETFLKRYQAAQCREARFRPPSPEA